MSLSRRSFIGSLTAACAVGSDHLWALETPDLKFGVLSDCHVRENPASTAALRRILVRFCRENVRVVVICGDVCHCGTLAELENVIAAWRDSFQNGRNAKGEKVEPFFVWGNHDYHEASFMRNKSLPEKDVGQAILYNKDKAWEMVTGEKTHPGEIFMRKVDGVTFIGAHWTHFDEELKPWLDAHRAEIPIDRPVFFVQHSHPYRTCFGTWYKASSRINFKTLMEHPNFFVMSGHSHISNSYDDGIWQGGFVSMAAGCANAGGPRRYEYNVGLSAKDKSGIMKHMPGQDPGGAEQASVVTVYPSRVVVTRWDHRNDEHIGEDWELAFPFVHDGQKAFRIAIMAGAPEFPNGAVVSVERKQGMLYPAKKKVPQIHITFPAASSVGPHSRVVDYRVCITRSEEGVVVAERLVAQRGLSLAESRTRAIDGWCVFGEDELPVGKKLVAIITPINAGGKSGKSIRKEFSL